jgi:hypothetical protein
MISDKRVTAFFHAKVSTVVMLLLACLSCWLAWSRDAVTDFNVDFGFGVPSVNHWIGFNAASAVLNLALNAVVASLIIFINSRFNVLRSLTALVATMFLGMQTALPSALGQFYGGTMLVLLMMLCVILLFSSYGDYRGQRQVFLIFAILGFALFTQINYLFFAPVLLLGCMQMRIFSLRTLLAALLGLITPAWILFGFGLISPTNLRMPEFVAVWALFDTHDMIQAIVTTGFTTVLGIMFAVLNLLKILSYNARVRAFNGFFTILFGYTALLTVANFNDFMFYIPLLNALVAYQVAHFFTYRRQRRSYLAILALLATYAASFLWAII